MTYGTVTAVEAVALGSALVADAAVSATTLAVDYAGDFDDTGGSLLLNGAVLDYTSADPATDLITLTVPLAVAAVVGDPVRVVDAGALAVEWVAHVALAEGDDPASNDVAGDTVTATIPTALIGYFPEGTYDQPVAVEVELRDSGSYVVLAQPDTAPLFDGALIDPTTVPPSADGVVPGPVATVVTLGGLGLIFVKWSAVTLNADGEPQVGQVTYQVHASTSATFTPDASTLIAQTAATMIAAKALTDDTPFSYDVPYYFAVVPTDTDGAGAASTIVTGSMDRTAGGDLAAGSVTAETLAGIVILGTTISTRSLDGGGLLTGPGLDLTNTGLYAYDSAGNIKVQIPNEGPAVFKGDAEIDHLTVATLTTLQATMLAQGSTLTLQAGVAAPSNPPTYTTSYTTTQHTDDGLWGNRVGWCTDGTSWYTARRNGVRMTTEKWNAAGVLLASHTTATDSDNPYGICWDGSYVVTLSHLNNGYVVLQRWTASTLASAGISNLLGTAAQMVEDQGETRSPALGWDAAASQYLIAQSRTTNADKVRIQRLSVDWVTPSLTWGTAVDSTHAYAYHLSHVLYGSFDLGASRYIFGNYGTSSTQVVTTAGVLDATNQWDHGTGTRIGMVWDGTAFVVSTTTGKRVTYEVANKWTLAADGTWHAAYTWRNATTPAETTLSPVTTFAMKKRARLTVATAALPAGVTEGRVYLAKGTTPPNITLAQMTLQGSTTGTTRLVTAAVFTPLNNPTVTTFGAGTAAALKSFATDGAGAIIHLKGDGSGRAGPLSWGTTGADTSDTGWVNIAAGTGITVPAGTLRYRRIGKWVHVEANGPTNNAAIAVGTTGAMTDTTLGTVPATDPGTGANLRPAMAQFSGGRWNRSALFYVNTTGTITCAAGDANGVAYNIAIGTAASCSFTYIVD